MCTAEQHEKVRLFVLNLELEKEKENFLIYQPYYRPPKSHSHTALFHKQLARIPQHSMKCTAAESEKGKEPNSSRESEKKNSQK